MPVEKQDSCQPMYECLLQCQKLCVLSSGEYTVELDNLTDKENLSTV
jgi:hypothetical protein